MKTITKLYIGRGRRSILALSFPCAAQGSNLVTELCNGCKDTRGLFYQAVTLVDGLVCCLKTERLCAQS